MTILKWISIILFLLFVALIAIVAIIKLFAVIGTIINIFKKYPEIGKYWFREDSYVTKTWGFSDTYDEFRLYTTKNGTVIKVSKKDGEILYHFKTVTEVLLLFLVMTILFFGCCNTILLFFD